MVYGADELVPAFEVFDAVAQGTAEMGHGAANYWKGKSGVAQFFAAVPFGMTAQEMNAWLYYGGGLALWTELYARFGLIPAPAGNTGVQMGGFISFPRAAWERDRSAPRRTGRMRSAFPPDAGYRVAQPSRS